jgi:hypothetical protein
MSRKKVMKRINPQLTFLFNDWVNKWALVEFKPSNRLFTWSNNQSCPILAALDKVFASTDWEQHFPLSSVHASHRAVSDHTPLVIDTGQPNLIPPKLFRFEKWWLSRPDFPDLVLAVWTAPCPYNTALDIWQFKLRQLRKKSKGWSINIEAESKKLKRDLVLEFDILDVFSEKNLLSPDDEKRMKYIKSQLDALWRQDETKEWQRSRDRSTHP